MRSNPIGPTIFLTSECTQDGITSLLSKLLLILIVPLSVSKMANGRWLRKAVILPAHPLGNLFISPAFL